MFIVFVYDSSKSEKFRKVAKKYLFWRQNSVFDWELWQWDFNKFFSEIKNLIEENTNDYCIFYKFKTIWTNWITPDIIELWKTRNEDDFIF